MARAAVWSLALSLIVATACASDEQQPEPVFEPIRPAVVLDRVGELESELSLIAFAGYVEDGSSDPEFDWVTEFQRRTGCAVRVRYVDTSEEVVSLLARRSGEYDGATVPGDAAGELIAAHRVAAVEPGLFPEWSKILAPLRGDSARHYTAGGFVYGVPALYGPNLLLYDTERAETAPTSWDVVFEPDTPYAGRIAMFDSPMSIADAALYLSVHEPGLGIEDPYALTPPQLDAATELLRDQEDRVGLYWRLLTDSIDGFRTRDVAVGAAWPIALSLLELDGRPIDAAEPEEGMTGWADTWMAAAGAPHPNCMLRWMAWTLTAEVQADLAFWYGGAPVNGEACDLIREELGRFADVVDGPRFGHCGDEEYLSSLALWRMPTVDCGDPRGRACTGLPAWRLHWSTIRD
jgi:putative spermidine/putrescine transport system substrate-binding protein